MKVDLDCLECLLHRAKLLTTDLLKVSREKSLEAIKSVMSYLSKEFDFDKVPAWLGTEREKILQRVLNISDPYKFFKEESNKIVKKVLVWFRDYLNRSNFGEYERFKELLLFSAVANSFDPFIIGYDFDPNDLKALLERAKESLAIDDSRLLWESLQDANVVLYVLDNAGESVADLEVVKFIKSLGKKVFVAAREKPIMNDITVEEAKNIGFEDAADSIIPVGWIIGVSFGDNANRKFIKAFNESDLAIFKGMAAYETLTEYELEKETYIILRAKCWPVARHLGVNKGEIVIKRLF